MSKKLLYLMSFVLVLAVTGTASADQWDITVPDAGFDDHVLNNSGDYVYVGDAAYTGAWKSAGGDAWIDYGYWAGDIDLPALSGNNKLYPYEDVEDYVYQILDETFIEGGTYTLSVWVGIAWSGYDDYCSLYFTGEDHTNNLSETSGSAPVGSWGQVSLVYTPTTADAGQRIGIKMTGAIYVTFEDVTLSYDGPAANLRATNPTPADGAMLEATWASLSWNAADSAVSHDVYMADNFDDVNDRTAAAFRGSQASASIVVGLTGFPFPDGLVAGTTYYWAIDEVEADGTTKHKGAVWSFSILSRSAYAPSPSDGSQYVDPDVTLNWAAGLDAALHYVHFGDSFEDMNNATGGAPVADTTFTPGTLELEKTYYWRVDEFDGAATHKGDVWSFSTIPIIAITDPSLVGWWKLDEDMGTTAVDWSGYGNHGTFEGDPQWVPGYDGAALEFDGDDHVDTGNTEDLANWTLTAWVISPEAPSSGSASGPVHREKNYQFDWNHGDETYRGAAAMRIGGTWYAASYQPLQANRWYHLAATYDGSVFNAYRDGVLITSNPAPSGPPDAETGTLKLGRHATAAQYFTGTVDNVRVYNKALTVEEIQLAMRGDPLLAWGPNPTNGSAVYIRDATPFSWSPGDNASQHDVYFGTDKGTVADADASDTTGIYRGRQGVTIYTPAEGVEWGGGPYYWRVDEYNTDATISKGSVWTFTVTDFIGIDDFEDYNDYPPDEIFSAWEDGFGTTTNGALIAHDDPPFAETTVVHGGGQSMAYHYDNNFKYSEATMTLVSARDWTEEGVGVLSLWFRGSSDNAAERMYVALNGSAVVYHDNPDAALIDEWMEWPIDLQEFAAQGVNLANVNTITIGFGDKNNLQAGGSGMVFFDDIRLYRPAQ